MRASNGVNAAEEQYVFAGSPLLMQIKPSRAAR
jgi:hypothetical protein